jgi:hypothetical protein
MAAHIDGYIATAAHTAITPTGTSDPVTGKYNEIRLYSI